MIRRIIRNIVWALALVAPMGLTVSGCNEDYEMAEVGRPEIEFDSPDGIYTVRVGRDVRIDPIVSNADGAEYVWTSADGEILSQNRALVMNCPRLGSYYVMLTVSTSNGSTSAEARIDVLEQTPPVIDLSLPEDGIYLLPDESYEIAPRYQHSDVEGFKVRWSVNGVERSEGEKYTFSAKATGRYHIVITAENEDGIDTRDFDVNVVNEKPRSIRFTAQTRLQDPAKRYTFAGRAVVLRPEMINIPEDTKADWSVNGEHVANTGREFIFTPDRAGSYEIAVTAAGVSASVSVVCVDATEESRLRKLSSLSSAEATEVWEYIPAPGQFIGDGSAAGGMPEITTHDEARKWAMSRMSGRQFVSLGAFGGYIVAGFDHSIEASADGMAELAVWGNAFDTSNEPGVVWVMQDINGNGLPDDEWYELRGSEYSSPAAQSNYTVTYYRPAGTGMDVAWSGSDGARGLIDFLPSQHSQLSYYPAWISEPTLTLRGSLLPPNGIYNEVTGQWSSAAVGWGYADNLGSDMLKAGDSTEGGAGQCVGLTISNAVMANGEALKLRYIDFVMVQSGQLQQLGRLGESSTEVCGISDRRLMK